MVGGVLAGHAPRVARLALEFVLLPGGLRAGCALGRPLDDDLVARLRHAPEGAVRVHEMARVERVVHELAPAEKVAHRPGAAGRHEDGVGEDAYDADRPRRAVASLSSPCDG